jgi:hypothetical protein
MRFPRLFAPAIVLSALIAVTALPASAAARPQPAVQAEMQQQGEPGPIERVVRAIRRVMHLAALNLDQPTNPHP